MKVVKFLKFKKPSCGIVGIGDAVTKTEEKKLLYGVISRMPE